MKFLLPATLLFSILLGCGSDYHSSAKRRTSDSYAPAVAAEAANSYMKTLEDWDKEGEFTGDESPTRSSAIDNRKIIYLANLQLVVENFDPVESAIRSLVKKHGAFIADATMGARNSQRRTGTWTIRTPADSFDDFLTGAGGIGVVVSRSRNSQDVTEEYVDIQARITNKKKLEARII